MWTASSARNCGRGGVYLNLDEGRLAGVLLQVGGRRWAGLPLGHAEADPRSVGLGPRKAGWDSNLKRNSTAAQQWKG